METGKFDVYPDGTLPFKLVRNDEDGIIDLIAVDEAGNPLPFGYVLGITPQGIVRHSWCRCGLPDDGTGHVKILN